MRSTSVGIWVVVAAMLVGCAHSSATRHAAIVIRAVRPTGDTWYRPHPQPIWQFAVTNTGDCELHWEGGVEDRGWTDRQYSVAGGHIEWPEGVLAPGQGLCTNMIVPARGTAWRAFVDYYPPPLTFKTKFRRYNDAWHNGS
jgi:hypothetical protein